MFFTVFLLYFNHLKSIAIILISHAILLSIDSFLNLPLCGAIISTCFQCSINKCIYRSGYGYIHIFQQTQVPPATEVRTLVVDMTDLEKVSFNSSDIEDSSDEIVLEDPIPAHIGKRQGGVLKGGEDYVSTGEPRPRPRVSFLLDAAPGQGQEGGAVQIRVYAKPPQVHIKLCSYSFFQNASMNESVLRWC